MICFFWTEHNSSQLIILGNLINASYKTEKEAGKYDIELSTRRLFLAKANVVSTGKYWLTSVAGVAYIPLSASELARVVEVKLEKYGSTKESA